MRIRSTNFGFNVFAALLVSISFGPLSVVNASAQDAASELAWAEQAVDDQIMKALLLERLAMRMAPELVTLSEKARRQFDHIREQDAWRGSSFRSGVLGVAGVTSYQSSINFLQAGFWTPLGGGAAGNRASWRSMGYGVATIAVVWGGFAAANRSFYQHKNHTAEEAIVKDQELREALGYDAHAQEQIERYTAWFGWLFDLNSESLALLQDAVREQLVRQHLAAIERKDTNPTYKINVIALMVSTRKADGTPLISPERHEAALELQQLFKELDQQNLSVVPEDEAQEIARLKETASTEDGKARLAEKTQRLQAVIDLLRPLQPAGEVLINVRANEFLRDLAGFIHSADRTIRLIEAALK